MDRQGRVTSHLSGIVYRTTNYLAAGIRPAFVFDGRPPQLKHRTIEARGEVKRKAERDWQDALEKGDLPRARTKAMQTSRLTGEMVDQSKHLLELLGVPWVQAPSEGEAQAAHIARNGDAWAAASQDYDSFLFGAPVLLRNLALSGKRKLPRKDVYVDVVPEQLELDVTLGALGMTREQLVDIGILVGTDFNEGVRGVGPKKALALLKQHGSREPALRAIGAEVEGVENLRDIFLSPDVTEAYALEWRDPDVDGTRRMLVEEHDFSPDRIDAAMRKLEEARKKSGQKSLDGWS